MSNFHQRTRGDVDNHLGHLNCMKRCLNTSLSYDDFLKKDFVYQQSSDKIEKSLTDKGFDNLYIIDNVLEDDFAKKVRDFLINVPHENISDPHYDGVEWIPKNTIHNLMKSKIDYAIENNQEDMLKENELYNNYKSTPNNWGWENYCNGNMWRLYPKKLGELYQSPIFDFLDKIDLFIKSNISQFLEETTNFIHAYQVIQKLSLHDQIGEHYDSSHGRKLAYIYYLTPEWKEEYGSMLCVRNANREPHLIEPKFNRMIIWPVSKDDKDNIPHSVTTLMKDIPRIALVGFVSSK